VADLQAARKVLETEAAAILALVDRIDHTFARAVGLVRECKGRIILTGMGKSGIICRKIAATLTSTGTAAFFLHPAEAVHGDLGVIQADDVVIAMSYSGETEELTHVLEAIKRLGARLIAITGELRSTLAQAADVVLNCHVSEEACPMNLVPTASTTACLAMGDALAMAVLVEKGFKPDDFATLHPGGTLGRRLMRAHQLMHAGEDCPVVSITDPIHIVLDTISRKGLGMTAVVDAERRLAGIITDGDLRRKLAAGMDFRDRVARDIMTPDPVTVSGDTMAAEALALLERRKITSVVVIDAERHVAGVLHLHDLWRTGMV
jgi:arabinose-5-phosphate isomerase